MTITFSNGQSQVGLWYLMSEGSIFSLSAYSGDALLETLITPRSRFGTLTEGFLALSGSNITSLVVSSTNTFGQNWNFKSTT